MLAAVAEQVAMLGLAEMAEALIMALAEMDLVAAVVAAVVAIKLTTLLRSPELVAAV